jgi:hypothetical protein
MLPSRCVIMASGASILDGTYQGLFNHLSKEVVFSLNDNIKFVKSTVAIFGDWTAYRDRFDLYKEHPLVIGRFDMHIGRKIEGALPCPKQEGLILLQGSGKWSGDKGLSEGLYSSVLTGAFTLNLAIRLGFKQIFLLGFDCCEINGQTHFYQNVSHAGLYSDYEGKPRTGVGKDEHGGYRSSFYNNADSSINSLWQPFTEELNNVQILNVSPLSRISVFQKIDYQEMFKTIKDNPIQINQDVVRSEIRQLLVKYNKA